MDHEDQRLRRQRGHRRKVLRRIEVEVLIDRRRDRVIVAAAEQQRAARATRFIPILPPARIRSSAILLACGLFLTLERYFDTTPRVAG